MPLEGGGVAVLVLSGSGALLGLVGDGLLMICLGSVGVVRVGIDARAEPYSVGPGGCGNATS